MVLMKGCKEGMYIKRRDRMFLPLLYCFMTALEAEWLYKEDDKNNNESVDTE